MLETEASGCADTGEMKYLGVNCVQGTAGLLPLNSDTHLHVPKYSQPYSTKILKGGVADQRSTLQMKEKKDGVTVRPVQSPSRHRPRTQAWSFHILQLVWKPIETLVETITARGACGLDVPVTLSQVVQA